MKPAPWFKEDREGWLKAMLIRMYFGFGQEKRRKWLLEQGASRDVRDESGARPIDMARAPGAIDAVAVLSEPGPCRLPQRL